jgi:hypothetical protein
MPNRRRGRKPPKRRGAAHRAQPGWPLVLDMHEMLPRILDDTDAYGRLLFAGAAALGGLRLTLDADRQEMGQITDTAPLTPVALIEPVITAITPSATPDGTCDLRIAVATKLGLDLLGARSPPVRSSANWTFRLDGNLAVLTDPTGTIVAQFAAAGDPSWQRQAAELGWVVVIYGAQIGVRLPPGATNESYNDQERARELRASRQAARVAAGVVRFQQGNADPRS